MNKAEIEEQIKSCELCRDLTEVKLEELNHLLAEAEKPKLRHGEIVISSSGEYIYLAMEQNPPSEKINIWGCTWHGEGFINGIVDKKNTYYKTLNINIFKILKEWSEDLEDTYIDGFHLRISGNTIVLGGRPFVIEQSEEVWHKLGQLIASLKRKLQAMK